MGQDRPLEAVYSVKVGLIFASIIAAILGALIILLQNHIPAWMVSDDHVKTNISSSFNLLALSVVLSI